MAIYIAFCLWAHGDELRTSRSLRLGVVSEIGGEVALLISALSYWLPSLREIPMLSALYAGGCTSFFAHAVLSGRKSTNDQALSFQGKVFVLISGAALGMVVTSPLLYWGWQSALRATYAEA